MEHYFEKVYEMLKLDRMNSAWSRKNTLEFRLAELQSEVDELKKALDNKDYQNMKEEIGDIIGDILFIAVMCHEYGYFSIEDVLQEYIKKFKRRKPWIFNGENLSIDEEMKRWREMKSIEKAEKS